MFMSTFIIFSILASWSSFSALSDICAATSSSNIIMDTTKERIFSRLLKRARGVKARTLLLGVSQLFFRLSTLLDFFSQLITLYFLVFFELGDPRWGVRTSS